MRLRQIKKKFLLLVLVKLNFVFVNVNFMLFTIVNLNSFILLKHLNFGYVIIKNIEIKMPIMLKVLYLKM